MDASQDLTDREAAALRGKLSKAEWDELGMDLFQKGLTALDPLTGEFSLTDKGREMAIQLRKPE